MIARELNKRRERVELNHMLKDGAVPQYQRAGEGMFNRTAEMAALGARLGEAFEPLLLGRAFVSRSHLEQEAEARRRQGVELEVEMTDHSALAAEGLACIRSALGAWLRAALPAFPEEGVAAVLEQLTSEEQLAEVGFHLGLRELVLSSVYPPARAELAATLAAVVGALAAQDPARADRLVVDLLASQLQGKDLNTVWEVTDPMGLLARLLEDAGRAAPEPRLLWRTGPGSLLASYTVGLYVDRELVGESPGESLHIAEEMAARDALRNLFKTAEHEAPLPWAKCPVAGASS
jgi:dsRNA-specific ribonuclease